VCDGLDNDCEGGVDENVCPDSCSARTYAGHVYLLCVAQTQGQRATYAQATSRCTQAGNNTNVGIPLELGRIESTEENDFVKSWIISLSPPEGMIWFGANDLDDERTWVYGRGQSAVQFFTQSFNGGGTAYMGRFNDFAAGRPNSQNNVDEDCAALDSDYSWQWNDLDCTFARLGYLCEQTP
jgi:hypothetical protein